MLHGKPLTGYWQRPCILAWVDDILERNRLLSTAKRLSGSKALTKPSMDPVVYDKTCASCHSLGLMGAPTMGDNIAWALRLAKGMEAMITNTLKCQAHSTDPYACLPVKGGCTDCTDAEAIAVVKYLAQNSQVGANYKLWWLGVRDS